MDFIEYLHYLLNEDEWRKKKVQQMKPGMSDMSLNELLYNKRQKQHYLLDNMQFPHKNKFSNDYDYLKEIMQNPKYPYLGEI